MRAAVSAIVMVIGMAAQPAFGQADRSAAAFWRAVQARCDATAAKPATAVGRRIAQTAIDEFTASAATASTPTASCSTSA